MFDLIVQLLCLVACIAVAWRIATAPPSDIPPLSRHHVRYPEDWII